MQVAEILRTKGADVATVAPDDTIETAVHTLRDRNVGALVVTADGTAIDGILSERDIVRALDAEPQELLDQPVSQIMTSEVFTCLPTDRVEGLMAMMTEKRIRHLPVEVEDSLAGIISIGDVVKHRVNELENEARAMEDYIHHGR